MGRKKSSVGCLFWLALVLLVLVIFLFNRNTIETVLERTGLINHLTTSRDESNTPVFEVERIDDGSRDTIEADPVISEDGVVDSPVPTTIVVEDPSATSPDERDEPDESPPSGVVRKSRIYFVHIDGERISLRDVERSVSFVDSPLTKTLETLLLGLSSTEIGNGLLSLVPEGTSLRGVSMRGNTAYIDLSESFRFNTFGLEGYQYQLKQIVFTATEFQSVNSVQILVEGRRISYLAPESPLVWEPLSRESFG